LGSNGTANRLKDFKSNIAALDSPCPKYNFKKSNGDIDLDAMVNELEKHLKRHFWKAA